MTKQILVTGANGFLGRHVVGALLARKSEDQSVRCLVRKGSSTNGLESSDVEIVRGSVEDEAFLPDLLEDVDVLIHLAASTGGSPMGMFLETVVSTEKLVDALNRSDVEKVLFCSSFSVYGASQVGSGDVLSEESPLETAPAERDPYAWCKYYQERWVTENLGKAKLVIVRPGVIYGKGRGLLSTRLGLQLPGLPIFLKIGGSAKVPLIHVRNCADLIALAALSGEVREGVFNAVDDDCPTQNEYLALYEKYMGKIPNKLPLPYPLFLAASWIYERLHRLSNGNFPGVFSTYKARSMYRQLEYSNAKAKKFLSWNPTISLADGLKEK